jgi:hypothetical protein
MSVQAALERCEALFPASGQVVVITAEHHVDFPENPRKSLCLITCTRGDDNTVTLLLKNLAVNGTAYSSDVEELLTSVGKLLVVNPLPCDGRCFPTLFCVQSFQDVGMRAWKLELLRPDCIDAGTDRVLYRVHVRDDNDVHFSLVGEGPIDPASEVWLQPLPSKPPTPTLQDIDAKLQSLYELVRAAVLSPGGAAVAEAQSSFEGNARGKKRKVVVEEEEEDDGGL